MLKNCLFFLFALSTIVLARENPFFPSSGQKDILYNSTNTMKLSPLQSASITLPSSARIIKKVTIEFENLDASIKTKSIELNNTVDWHLPIFISQSYANTKKSKTQNRKKTPYRKNSYKKVGSIKYASFYADTNRFKIVTKDIMIRNFLIANPHRIVIDFKRDSYIKTYTKFTHTPFKKIRVGTHDGYYRVVLELDGLYKYSSKKISNGYEFYIY